MYRNSDARQQIRIPAPNQYDETIVLSLRAAFLRSGRGYHNEITRDRRTHLYLLSEKGQIEVEKRIVERCGWEIFGLQE